MMKKILLLLLGFSLITYCSIFNISALDTTLNYEQKHFIDLCFTDRFIIYEGNKSYFIYRLSQPKIRT